MWLVWTIYLFFNMGLIWMSVGIWATVDSGIYLISMIVGIQSVMPFWWLVVLLMAGNVVVAGLFTYSAFMVMRQVNSIEYILKDAQKQTLI